MSKIQKFHLDEFVPLSLPIVMFLLGNRAFTFYNIFEVFVIWTCIIMSGSFFFVGHAVAASHHAPPIVHEGDEFKSLDFGVYQLSAVFDRKEANSNLFMTLAHFGFHSLHHMFPSLDHSLLPQLQDVFFETCVEFEVELKKMSFMYSYVGFFEQLGRTTTIKLNAKEPEKDENNNKNIATHKLARWKNMQQVMLETMQNMFFVISCKFLQLKRYSIKNQ
jgi:fatty acid desaturase